MSEPTVSICVPAFRAERFLPETLESVLGQTFQDWELIVVEDGSCDGTERIVAGFAARATQTVRFLRHPSNLGLPAARNTAISHVSGKWAALLDSDDIWEPDHLEGLMSRARDSSRIEFVYAGSRLFHSDTGLEFEVRAPTGKDVRDFPYSLFGGAFIIQPSAVMLTRSLWERVGGFDQSLRYAEDLDMWLRCARAGAEFAYTGSATCRYRKHASALSSNAAAMAEAEAAIFGKHRDWEAIPLRTRLDRAAGALASAGRLQQRSDPARSARYFRQACGVDWRLDWWLRGRALALISALQR